MKFSPALPTALIGAAIAAVQLPFSVARAEDVAKVAREITVRIDGPAAGGSGFIVELEGNTYTVLTNWHVVDREGDYTVRTGDGQQHRVSQIRELPGADLAVLSFTTSRRYRVAELGDSDRVNLTQTVYVAGWFNPLSEQVLKPSYSFIDGKITSVLPQPNERGYSLVYNTPGNYKGMSGGPVLDEQGKVLGINGEAVGNKQTGPVGLYLAIPINTFERSQIGENAEEAWNRGRARLDLGNYERAIEYFNKAISLNPNYADAYNDRGRAYRRRGSHERAIENFERAISLNPNHAEAYNNRGFAYSDLRSYERAIADFNQAISIKPDYALAYNNRGRAYRLQENYERAIADFNQAIRLNPDYALAYNNRGLAYRSQGRYERAIADFNRALGISPDSASVYNNRGLAYRKLRKHERAIADYNRAILINPDYALAYYNRGVAHLNVRERLRAIEDFRKAAELSQTQGETEIYQRATNKIQELLE
ncbi:MAG: serine protease [Oscillatoria sp. SIO1A7]|nr:serine protease [Oscillatoria sp. SIO1A7]